MKTIEDIYAEMFEEHENVQAARRAQKLEEIEAANPHGCNQHKHKPGCPEAEGGASMENLTTKQKYELFRGAWASAVDKNTGKKIRLQITALQADAIARWGVVGEDNGRIWVMNGGNKYYLEDRTLEDIVEAANPYGCNQYGEGWKQPHNGKQSKSGSPVKKGDSSPAAEKKETKETPKKEEEKAEENETEENDDDDNAWPERSKDYREWRHDIEEVMHKAFARMARGYPVTGIYFDGENFHTDNQDGRATLLYTGDDIDDFLEENNMQESTVDDQTERFMQSRGRDIFDEIDWDEVEENKRHYDKWKR